MPRTAKQKKESKELAKYLTSLIENEDIGEVTRKTNTLAISLERMKNEYTILHYSQTLAIVNNYGGSEKRLREIIDQDYTLLYEYWNYIEPNAERIEKIGMVMRYLLEDRKLLKKELCEALNIPYNKQSEFLNCQRKIPSKYIGKAAIFFNMTPKELIYKLKGYDAEIKAAAAFGKEIANRRECLGYFKTDVAEQLGVTEQFYDLFEKGVAGTSKIFIVVLCRALDLDEKTYLKKANKARICKKEDNVGKLKAKIDRIETGNKSTRVSLKGDLEEYLCQLTADYRYVTYGDTAGTKTDTHTFTTLTIMCLMGCMQTRQDNQGDIVYYLKNLDKTDKNLAVDIVNGSSDSNISEETDYKNVAMAYRKKKEASFTEIGHYTNCVKSTAFNAIAKGKFNSCLMINDIYKCIGLSTAYGIEGYLKDNYIPKDMTEKWEKSEVSINTILKEIDNNKYWDLWDYYIPSKMISEVISIITSDEPHYEKYKKICKVELPQNI